MARTLFSPLSRRGVPYGQSACKPIPKGNRCWRGGGELGPSLERSQTEKKPSSQGPFPRACPYYQVFLSVFDYLLEVINTLKEFLEAEFGNGLSLSSPICTHMHTYTHAHIHMHSALVRRGEGNEVCVSLSEGPSFYLVLSGR